MGKGGSSNNRQSLCLTPMGESDAVPNEDRIPLEEIELKASRSSGPGGQHANSASSRIEAVFIIDDSATLSDDEKTRLKARYGNRISAHSQDARGQARNRVLALQRLREKIEGGLKVQKKRTKTKPSKAAKEKRLESKKIQSQKKQNRSKNWD